jgi:hypothetical protein
LLLLMIHLVADRIWRWAKPVRPAQDISHRQLCG